MVRRRTGADTRAVHMETLSPELVHTVDAIELPPVGSAVLGQAERRDTYPIFVTRSPEETTERLLQAIGDAHVAVITDETVADLYGALVFGALQKAGVKPEIAAVPAGERHKTIRQATDLLDWLTGTRWLVGDIAEVSAFEHTRNAITVLRFAAGAMGIVDNSRHAGYGFECSLEVVGSESTLRIGGPANRVAEDNIDRHGSAYLEELRHFVDCVDGVEEPRVGGEDALAALRLALAAEHSVA
jgi:hypothetical protein